MIHMKDFQKWILTNLTRLQLNLYIKNEISSNKNNKKMQKTEERRENLFIISITKIIKGLTGSQ